MFAKFKSLQKFKHSLGHLSNFETIYNNKKLESYLAEYFKNKVIFNDLMTSRLPETSKLLYSIKIERFEKAFKNKRFSFS